MSQDDTKQTMTNADDFGLMEKETERPSRFSSDKELSYVIYASSKDDDDLDDEDDFNDDDDYYNNDDEDDENPFEREPDEDELIDDVLPLDDPEDDLTDDDDEIPYNWLHSQVLLT